MLHISNKQLVGTDMRGGHGEAKGVERGSL